MNQRGAECLEVERNGAKDNEKEESGVFGRRAEQRIRERSGAGFLQAERSRG